VGAAAEVQAYVWLYLDQAMDLGFGAIGNALYKLLDHEWQTATPSADTFTPRQQRKPSRIGSGIDYGFDPVANALWFRRDWPTPPKPSTLGETPITETRLRNLFDTDREIYKDLMAYFEDSNGYRAWHQRRVEPVFRNRTPKLLKILHVEEASVRRCRGAVVLGASNPLIWIGVTHDEVLIRERDAGKRVARIQRRIERATAEQNRVWTNLAEQRYGVTQKFGQPEHAAAFTSMMREMIRERYNATPVSSEFDRMTARLGTEEGEWLVAYLPNVDTKKWAADLKAATSAGVAPDLVLAITTARYDVANSDLTTALAGTDILVPVRILDVEAALRWCGLVPWVWSKHYGQKASAHIIRPGDEEHLRTVLGASGKSVSVSWDGSSNRRLIALTPAAVAEAVFAAVRSYDDRIVVVVDHGIDPIVRRIAESWITELQAAAQQKFVIITCIDQPHRAAKQFDDIDVLLKWENTPHVHALIGHTPASTAQLESMNASRFAAPIDLTAS